eukprot:Em0012g21a
MSPTSGATLSSSSSSSSARRRLFEEVVVATGAGAAAVVTSKAVATRSDVSATARVTLSAELRRSYVLYFAHGKSASLQMPLRLASHPTDDCEMLKGPSQMRNAERCWISQHWPAA